MESPLYDPDLDSIPPRHGGGPGPGSPDAKSKSKRGRPNGPAKEESTGWFNARLSSMGLADMLGIGIFLGFLASSLLTLAISPSVVGFATLIGMLLSLPLLAWVASRFGHVPGRATGAFSRSAARAWDASLRWLRVDGVKAVVLSALCFAAPCLLAAIFFSATMWAGYSMLNRDSVVWIVFPVFFMQVGLIAASQARAATSAKPKAQKTHGARGRAEPLPSEILPNLAAFFGMAFATVPLNNPAALARDVPLVARLATAIPGWKGPAFTAAFMLLVFATLGCYLAAVLLALMKSDGTRRVMNPDSTCGSGA